MPNQVKFIEKNEILVKLQKMMKIFKNSKKLEIFCVIVKNIL